MAQNTRPALTPLKFPGRAGLTYGLLGLASVGCAGLFWRLGAVDGLVATIQLACVVGYVVICWWRPALGLTLLVTLAVYAETQDYISDYDPTARIEYSLHSSFNTTVGGPPVTPLEVLMLILGLVVIFKRLKDPAALPMPARLFGAFRWTLYAFGAMLVWGYTWGVFIKHGDSIKGLWEVRAFSYMLLFYMLAGIILSRQGDWRSFFKIAILGIGLIGLKVVLRWIFYLDARFDAITDRSFDHENALFYNSFFLTGLASFLYRPKVKTKGEGFGRGWWTLYFGLLPFVIFADLLQQRRGGIGGLVIGILLTLILGLRIYPRRIITFLVICVLVITPYYVVFSSEALAGNPVGLPARAIKSIIAPDKRDASSNEYREIEYFNLIQTVNTSPILGIGFGQEFLFVKPMPSLAWWPFWHYTPHNEVIWVWLKVGLPGFLLLWLLVAQAVLRGIYIFWLKASPGWRPALLVVIAAIVMQIFYAWLDQGFSRPRNMIWFGTMMALLGFWQLTSRHTQDEYKRTAPPNDHSGQ